MASFNKFNQFVEDLAKGVHDFTGVGTAAVKVALTNTLPVSTNTVYANITSPVTTNVSSLAVSGIGVSNASGTVTLTASDLTITASGTTGSFRYVVLYNDTPTSPAKPLIGWYDYGSSISLNTGETFTVDFTTTGFATIA